MEAKARGRQGHPRRPAVHPHQRDGRPPRARSGPAATSSSSAASSTTSSRTSADFREYVVAYTNAADDRRARTSGTPRTWTACSPASTPRRGTLRRPQLAVRRHRGRPARRRATHERDAGERGPRRRGATSRGRPSRPGPTRPSSTPAASSSSSSRHFARYTPEMVEQVCGVPRDRSCEVAEALCANSGRERTSAFCYAVGWTQHTVGVQYIRTAAIIQLLLGNIGRPGGGILALRGHATIQGSTDIPTLYNLLPGYLPMPHRRRRTPTSASYHRRHGRRPGYWGHFATYMVSLLKAWCGDAATAENDYCFDYLPAADRRPLDLPDRHRRCSTARCKGFFVLGREPGGRPANARLHRRRLAKLDWLVVRDFVEIETARSGTTRPRSRRRAAHRRHRHRGVPPARGRPHREGRHLHQHPAPAAVAPQGGRAAGRLPLRPVVHLPPGPQHPREAGRLDRPAGPPAARPDLGLPDRRSARGADAERGAAGDQRRRTPTAEPLSGYRAAGRRLDRLRLLDLLAASTPTASTRPTRRKPGSRAELGRARVGLGVARQPPHPLQPGLGRPGGQPVVGAQAVRVVGRRGGALDRARRPRLPGDHAARLRPARRTPTAEKALAATSPFIMQADGKGWLFVPDRPRRRPAAHPLRAARVAGRQPALRPARPTRRPRSTTGRTTATTRRRLGATLPVRPHHLPAHRAPHCRRDEPLPPYLAELQPEMFCEVSPELAAERGLVNGGWATIITARGGDRGPGAGHRPDPAAADRRPGRPPGRPALPLGLQGLATGDVANDLLPIVGDPNVHIQEAKAATCDIRPGRRPRGPALVELVDGPPGRPGGPGADRSVASGDR